MIKAWRIELNQFIFLVIIGAGGGWLLDQTGWGVALVMVFFTGWQLLRLRELVKWLDAKNKAEAPESTGIWGQIFDHLYHNEKDLQKKNLRLRFAIERARQSTDAIKDAIVTVDKNGCIQWWNDSANQVLGLKKKTDRHQSITNLLRDPRFIQYFEERNYSKSLEIPNPIAPNDTLQVDITEFGQEERLLVARDITNLKLLEQMRKDFVANLSHELRTPLTVIKGYLEPFLDMITPESNPTLHRGLSQMDQQARRMETLIADLLLLSKLENESNKTVIKPINMPSLLTQVHAEAKALNEEKLHTIELDIDTTLHLLGEEADLRSAFTNLVVNAIKYTPAQGHINVKWWHDSDGAHLTVEDNGEGIEERHIPRLTERFYRADQSRYSKTGGTGLGLAIVKHVLLHHDGHLEIKSTLGKGSSFTCHFPARNIILHRKSSRVAAL